MLKDSEFTAFQLSDYLGEPGFFGPVALTVAGVGTAGVCVSVRGCGLLMNS